MENLAEQRRFFMLPWKKYVYNEYQRRKRFETIFELFLILHRDDQYSSRFFKIPDPFKPTSFNDF